MKQISNIVSLFIERANSKPNHLAIAEINASITYGSLRDEVFEYAAYLRKKGIGQSDRILVFLPVSINLYKVVLAIMSIGATAVFLDQWSDLKRLKKAAKLADCKALVAGKKLRFLSYFIAPFRHVKLKLRGTGKDTPIEKVIPVNLAETAALITFTTGSSGTPKAAWRTHQFLHAQHIALIKELKPTNKDVCVTTLPVFTFSNLASGCTTLLPPFNPKKLSALKIDMVLEQLQQATTLLCSPDFLLRLLPKAAHQNWPKLEKVFTGGAPVFPAIAAAIEKVFPQTIVAYGSTEAEPIASTSVGAIAKQNIKIFKGVFAGRLHESVTVKIIPIVNESIAPSEKDWQNLPLVQGQIGEIVVSGSHVLEQYFKNEKAQKRQKFTVNNTLWHRTGDSGFFDERGNLFLTGLCRYAFWYKEKFYTLFELEHKLQSIDGIAESTVLKFKDFTHLFVVSKSGFSQKNILQTVAKQDIPFDKVHWLQALPKDPRHNSKVDYGALLEEI